MWTSACAAVITDLCGIYLAKHFIICDFNCKMRAAAVFARDYWIRCNGLVAFFKQVRYLFRTCSRPGCV